MQPQRLTEGAPQELGLLSPLSVPRVTVEPLRQLADHVGHGRRDRVRGGAVEEQRLAERDVRPPLPEVLGVQEHDGQEVRRQGLAAHLPRVIGGDEALPALPRRPEELPLEPRPDLEPFADDLPVITRRPLDVHSGREPVHEPEIPVDGLGAVHAVDPHERGGHAAEGHAQDPLELAPRHAVGTPGASFQAGPEGRSENLRLVAPQGGPPEQRRLHPPPLEMLVARQREEAMADERLAVPLTSAALLEVP